MVSKLRMVIATEKFNCISLRCAFSRGSPAQSWKAEGCLTISSEPYLPPLLCDVNGQFERRHGSVRSIREHPACF